jgi:acetate---CoA ligase (ADP-forming)
MIGITQDPLFGPLIAFGLGGIHVEIINDVCFRVTPISDRDASDMVQSIRGYRLLQGLILVLPLGKGCMIVDARIRVAE